MNTQIEYLNLVGLVCPFVAAETKKVLARLPKGARLVVLSDDPLAAVDLPALVNDLGFQIAWVVNRGSEVEVAIDKIQDPSI